MQLLERFATGNNREKLDEQSKAIRRERDNLGLEFGFAELAIREGDASPAALDRKAKASAAIARLTERERELDAALRAIDAREAAKRVAAAEKTEADKQRRRDEIAAERHQNALALDVAIDQLATVVKVHYDLHRELDGLNPPASIALPNGIPMSRLLEIVEFRSTWCEGMTYFPFYTLEESTVAYYFPKEK